MSSAKGKGSGGGGSNDSVLKTVQDIDQAYARRAEADAALRKALTAAATTGIKGAQNSSEAIEHLSRYLEQVMPW
jgi:hypothetical protein